MACHGSTASLPCLAAVLILCACGSSAAAKHQQPHHGGGGGGGADSRKDDHRHWAELEHDWVRPKGPWARGDRPFESQEHRLKGNDELEVGVQSPLVNYTTDVFLEKEDGIATYRIPAIVQISGGSDASPILLAFAEARKDSSNDCGRKAVVVKASHDLGKTWGKLVNVYGLDIDHLVAGNQQVVVDTSNDRVLVHFSTSPQGVSCSPSKCNWQTVSADRGSTWSEPTNISDALQQYIGVSPGPGDALQLTKIKPGRLIFSGHYGAYREDIVWLSDDHGATYRRVNVTFPKMDETTLTQLPNGSVLLNMRNAHVSACKCRGVSRSDDGGDTWGPVRYDKTLISPVCEAALAQIGERLYFSNPASTSSRENLTVRVSDDGGTTWREKTLLVQGGSVWGGYSSLVPGELGGSGGTGLGGVLYERYSSGKQAISFSAFPLDFDKL